MGKCEFCKSIFESENPFEDFLKELDTDGNLRTHCCEDGSIGVIDFQGFKVVKE